MVLALAPASAQSTLNVGHFERPLQFEISIGTGPGDTHPEYFCCGDGPARFAAAGLRWRATNDGGVRVGVMGLDRRSLRSPVSFSSGPPDSIRKHERIVAVTLLADAALRLVGDLRAGLTVGGGYAPYVRGEQSTNNSSQGFPQSYASKESSLLGMGSLSLRYRWFFVEQHLIILTGANNAVRENRELLPLAIGLRL